MTLTARKIAEQEGRFAMELDLPLWATGKFFCHEYNAECELCTLNDVCPKIFEINDSSGLHSSSTYRACTNGGRQRTQCK
jgi:hypothetical protein